MHKPSIWLRDMLIITRWNGVTFYASAFRNADISWPLSELVRFWSRCVDFLNFGIILTLWNCSNSRIMGIFCTMHRMAWKFGMLMHPDHLQKWLHFDHVLLISKFWCNFDLVKWVKFVVYGIFWRMHGRNGLKFGILILYTKGKSQYEGGGEPYFWHLALSSV